MWSLFCVLTKLLFEFKFFFTNLRGGFPVLALVMFLCLKLTCWQARSLSENTSFHTTQIWLWFWDLCNLLCFCKLCWFLYFLPHEEHTQPYPFWTVYYSSLLSDISYCSEYVESFSYSLYDGYITWKIMSFVIVAIHLDNIESGSC